MILRGNMLKVTVGLVGVVCWVAAALFVFATAVQLNAMSPVAAWRTPGAVTAELEVGEWILLEAVGSSIEVGPVVYEEWGRRSVHWRDVRVSGPAGEDIPTWKDYTQTETGDGSVLVSVASFRVDERGVYKVDVSTPSERVVLEESVFPRLLGLWPWVVVSFLGLVTATIACLAMRGGSLTPPAESGDFVA
ncbi:MAG: hypothetical protein Q8P38_11750 [Candidatus Nanopelagicales bacterium]|nr:hypothetical protein [Candidatus Nanopelagicales bacterium]